MQSFPCPHSDCDRSYPTKNSLARHVHNHREADHECDLCGVKFRRRDILLRHRKIHTGSKTLGEPANPDANLRKRRRCHTACQLCRKARSKCDGEQPCSTCRAAEKECEYDHNTLRLSHKPLLSADAESSPNYRGIPGDDTVPVPSGADPRILPQLEPHGVSSSTWQQIPIQEQSYVPDVEAPMKTVDRRVDTHAIASEQLVNSSALNGQQTVGGYNGGFDEATLIESSLETPHWQWMHEDMFLQTNPSSVWLTEYSQQRFPPNALPQPGSMSMDHAAAPVMQLPSPPTTIGWSNTAQAVQNQSNFPDVPGPAHPNQARGSPFTHGPRDKLDHHGVDAILKVAQASSSQSDVVRDMVDYAKKVGINSAVHDANHGEFWRMISARVDEAFFPGVTSREGPFTLHRFIDLYFAHFHLLWVLIVNPHKIDFNTLHPIIYLTLASIGGMYDGNQGATCGALLHEALRGVLTANPAQFAESEPEPLWLVQALVLTQLAAVYFGHRRAFSAAQHIGCILFTQSRRMNLFSARRYRRKHIEAMRRAQSIEQRRKIWITLESKVRLAYGIYRADIYLSVLLNTRPFMSHSEMEVEVDEYVFNPDIINRMDEHINSTIHDPNALRHKLLFSDLLRIALDREEPLPALSLPQHEILIWSLNEDIWEYCHDPSAVSRLTGVPAVIPGGLRPQLSAPTRQLDSSIPYSSDAHSFQRSERPPNTPYIHDEPIGYSRRTMGDLRSSSDRLFAALTKWERSFVVVSQDPVQQERFRDKVVVSLLLYHLTYIRLNAPIESLHQICYSLEDREGGGRMPDGSAPRSRQPSGAGLSSTGHGHPARSPDGELLAALSMWLASGQAEIAVEHACQIWAIIAKELTRPTHQRAKLNLMAFIGLHHSGAVVWSWSLGKKRENTSGPPDHLTSPSLDQGQVLGRHWQFTSDAKASQWPLSAPTRNLVLPVGKIAAEVSEGKDGAAAVRVIAALAESPNSTAESSASRSTMDGPSSARYPNAVGPPGTVIKSHAMPADVQMCREEIPRLLASFARLYEQVNPAWGVRSSFAQAAWRLARTEAPSWFG
ncbi:hypothetical protein P152DRAFT_133990 [Eremomyces bilateralis CBS 781.70]|uniref:Zn(2)-C6 fungal-type domain-containing protein n=1 Tax=Eremomyces bilateralis CBS 781.70 TaxID=1392243 RepID=A0A6G1GFR8_9PEZI|nr:uncharacterized protein P152DRAFT_133990 [Eremomyces bilateralis CBS 781.70]KAF1816700.1 hypothetical protein P152DRAFT_133990 [Eremomyces bilateralis CBS 781.70]